VLKSYSDFVTTQTRAFSYQIKQLGPK